MAMKFSRAYCAELQTTLSPYRARELFVSEDSEYVECELTFHCEDQQCRARLTPVGIYMARKSKRALHFRTQEAHAARCSFLQPDQTDSKPRKSPENEDDYKLTNFPTELILAPCKRTSGSGGATMPDDDDEGGSAGGTSGSGGGHRRQTSTRTRYLDFVVDCFLSGDEQSKDKPFTIGGRTMAFRHFFKRAQYFRDREGLIYYGTIDRLEPYKGKGIGLRFAELVRHKAEKKSYRLWLHVPQERVDASRRKKAFQKEVAELKKAVNAGEEVMAFFVGTYPAFELVEPKNGSSFHVYRAELQSIDHLTLVFART